MLPRIIYYRKLLYANLYERITKILSTWKIKETQRNCIGFKRDFREQKVEAYGKRQVDTLWRFLCPKAERPSFTATVCKPLSAETRDSSRRQMSFIDCIKSATIIASADSAFFFFVSDYVDRGRRVDSLQCRCISRKPARIIVHHCRRCTSFNASSKARQSWMN